MIVWVEDQDHVITNNTLEQQFGPLGEVAVDDVLEKSEQVQAAPSDLEALQCFVRRWDPLM